MDKPTRCSRLAGITDKQAGIKKVKEGLENHLTDVKYDEPSKTKDGAVVITGTGKPRRPASTSFSRRVSSMPARTARGAAFVVDSKIEDHYKETVRGICQTIRRGGELAKQTRTSVPK